MLAHGSRPRRRRRAALTAIVLTGLAAASCSSRPATGRADKAFLAKAEHNCALALQQVSPSPFPYEGFNPLDPIVTELPGAAGYYDSEQFNHQELAFVTAFGRPKQGRTSWQQFVTLVGQQQAAVAAEISSGKASDKAGFVTAVRQSQSIGARIVTTGTTVGFPAGSSCLQLFGS